MVLENAVADPDGAGPLEALDADTTVIGRTRTTNTYDENKPDGATYHLVTTETKGALVNGYPLADVRITKTGYEAEHGGVSGWSQKKATKAVTDVGGTNATSYTVYDAAGRVRKSLAIGTTGSDAGTTETIYFTAEANSAYTACGNRPEWAGSVCLSRAAGAVTGHDPARMADELPVRRVVRYNRFGSEAEVVETAAGESRTTVIEHDASNRDTRVAVTSALGVAVPAITTTYDPTNGKPVTTVMGDATISREYDLLGRLVRYTDADGGRSVSEFNRFEKLAKISDSSGSSSFAYDRTLEPRGLLTSVTDSTAGTFSAAYGPDGNMVQLKYPGGLTRTDRLDANLQPVERSYTRDADGEAIYSEAVVENSSGQTVHDEYTGGAKAHSYDRLGRLTKTQHDSAMTAGCMTRTYRLDQRSNREQRSAYAPGAEGACQEDTAATVTNHSYDSADRLLDAGYTYDAFGRTTEVPGGLKISYHVNDRVQQQELGDVRQSWTLDPVLRLRGTTTTTHVEDSWVVSASKVNHYGDDTDQPRWIVEDTATGIVTRNVAGPDGELVATTSDGQIRLQLTNLHGDVVVSVDPALSEPEVFDADEFGIPMQGQTTQRYGWLGGKYRSSEALTGIVLMGVRLYNPATGRFLSVDPVPGGSCSSYDYACADPVNGSDLDGRRWCWKFCSWSRNPYWRMAFHGGRMTLNIAAWGYGYGEARAGYRAVRGGYRTYRYVRKHGYKAKFYPLRRKDARTYYRKQAFAAGGYLMGYHDVRQDWRDLRQARRDAWRPISRKVCRGVRRLVRWGHGNSPFARSYNCQY